MPAGKWLHRVELTSLAEGTYWHVYRRAFGPLVANPGADGRLALRSGRHAMFYFGDTPQAALWESALRDASLRNRIVFVDPSQLAGRSIAKLTLTAERPALDLRTPFRRALVDHASPIDQRWSRLLVAKHYDDSHKAAEAVRLQCEKHDPPITDMPSFAWHSRMLGKDTAFLSYAPPMTASWWRVDTTLDLDDDAGDAFIRAALEEQGLIWPRAPTGVDFDEPT